MGAARRDPAAGVRPLRPSPWHRRARTLPIALRALGRQLPGYARWLAEMQVLRRGGARGWWRHRTGTDARDWEEWLALARQETDE